MATILSSNQAANALTFAFDSTISGNQYSGTLEFAGEGNNLSPLFTTSTKLDFYQGTADGSVYQSACSSFLGSAPSFDVTNTTLTITTSGGMTFASGNQIDFFTSGDLGDPAIFEDNSVTFTPASVPVPFEVSPTLGLLAVGGIWSISRLRKKAKVG